VRDARALAGRGDAGARAAFALTTQFEAGVDAEVAQDPSSPRTTRECHT
jgi:hypothetical protein